MQRWKSIHSMSRPSFYAQALMLEQRHKEALIDLKELIDIATAGTSSKFGMISGSENRQSVTMDRVVLYRRRCADCLQSLGRSREAADEANVLLALGDTGEFYGHHLLSRLAVANRDWPAALEHAKSALKLTFETEVFVLLIKSLFALGRDSEALAATRDALRVEPKAITELAEIYSPSSHEYKVLEGTIHAAQALFGD